MSLPCKECKGRCCTYPMFSKDELKLVKLIKGIPAGSNIQGVVLDQMYAGAKPGSSIGYVLSKQNGDCPYLAADGACSIYELRPKVCKDYGVVPDLPCEYLYPKEAKFYHEQRLSRAKKGV
jgi:Fe-S-cluster containining protein